MELVKNLNFQAKNWLIVKSNDVIFYKIEGGGDQTSNSSLWLFYCVYYVQIPSIEAHTFFTGKMLVKVP